MKPLISRHLDAWEAGRYVELIKDVKTPPKKTAGARRMTKNLNSLLPGKNKTPWSKATGCVLLYAWSSTATLAACIACRKNAQKQDGQSSISCEIRTRKV